MKLLIDPIFEEAQLEVIEEEGKGKQWVISGPFSYHSTKNNNSRLYPESTLDREIEKFQNLIESGQAVGELDHPESPRINLKNISHKITGLKKEGKVYTGKAILLNTPSGKIAQSLAENGVKLGISSRALGSLTEKDNTKHVNEDLHLITWDIVSRPSFSTCILDAVFEEKEWDIVEGKIIEITGNVKENPDNEKIKALLEWGKNWRDKYYMELILDSLKK